MIIYWQKNFVKPSNVLKNAFLLPILPPCDMINKRKHFPVLYVNDADWESGGRGNES
jgi:hypothetical protein